MRHVSFFLFIWLPSDRKRLVAYITLSKRLFFIQWINTNLNLESSLEEALNSILLFKYCFPSDSKFSSCPSLQDGNNYLTLSLCLQEITIKHSCNDPGSYKVCYEIGILSNMTMINYDWKGEMVSVGRALDCS